MCTGIKLKVALHTFNDRFDKEYPVVTLRSTFSRIASSRGNFDRTWPYNFWRLHDNLAKARSRRSIRVPRKIAVKGKNGFVLGSYPGAAEQSVFPWSSSVANKAVEGNIPRFLVGGKHPESLRSAATRPDAIRLNLHWIGLRAALFDSGPVLRTNKRIDIFPPSRIDNTSIELQSSWPTAERTMEEKRWRKKWEEERKRVR